MAWAMKRILIFLFKGPLVQCIDEAVMTVSAECYYTYVCCENSWKFKWVCASLFSDQLVSSAKHLLVLHTVTGPTSQYQCLTSVSPVFRFLKNTEDMPLNMHQAASNDAKERRVSWHEPDVGFGGENVTCRHWLRWWESFCSGQGNSPSCTIYLNSICLCHHCCETLPKISSSTV